MYFTTHSEIDVKNHQLIRGDELNEETHGIFYLQNYFIVRNKNICKNRNNFFQLQ